MGWMHFYRQDVSTDTYKMEKLSQAKLQYSNDGYNKDEFSQFSFKIWIILQSIMLLYHHY